MRYWSITARREEIACAERVLIQLNAQADEESAEPAGRAGPAAQDADRTVHHPPDPHPPQEDQVAMAATASPPARSAAGCWR